MSDPRDDFGLGEDLQRADDLPASTPRRNLLWRILLIAAALLALIVWAPLP